MKTRLLFTHPLALFILLLFAQQLYATVPSPTLLGPLEPITFESGTIDYIWDTWGNLDDPNAFQVIDNPFKSGINTSDKVGKYTCNSGSNSWAGMNIHDSVEITITENNKFFTMDVYKSSINKVVMVLEQGNGSITRFDSYPYNSKTDEWETIVFDMSSVIGNTFYRLTIQPDLTETDPRSAESIVYLDNIKFFRNNPLIANPLNNITFETEGDDYEWITFDNPSANNDDASFTIVDNPDASGRNTSVKVGKYITHSDAALWAGVKTDALTPVVITENNKWLSMDVYKTSTNNVGLKYEGGKDGQQKDCFVTPSTTGEWETLVFDFSAVVGDTFPTFVIFPDWSATDPRTEEAITYFDNIEWHATDPSVGILQNLVPDYKIYPNPAENRIVIEGILEDATMEIFNIDGKCLARYTFLKNQRQEIYLDELASGTYIMRITSKTRVNSLKFVKK